MNYKDEFKKIGSKYINNKILNEFSDIYIDEFFMYHVLESDIKSKFNLVPSVEIYLIYKKFIENSYIEFLEIFNKINTNLKEIKDFDKEYLKLKNTINSIFNHQILSSPIKLLNLSIIFCNVSYNIQILNTEKCKKIIEKLIYKLQFELNNDYSYNNKISLNYNNKTLNENYCIDFYNIKNNDVIHTVLIQTS
jgi:hypothetical protein